MTGQPETPARCGAGHLCCSDLSKPPEHDHFLRADECPRCQAIEDTEVAR